MSAVCPFHLAPQISHFYVFPRVRSAKNHQVVVLFSFSVTSAQAPMFSYFFLMAFDLFAILSAAVGAQRLGLTLPRFGVVLWISLSTLIWLEYERSPRRSH